MRRNSHTPAALLAVACSILLTGCGGGSKATMPKVAADPLPAGTVLNDTPSNTMSRFKATFEYQSHQSYAAVLAGDFRFGFSAITDPGLVAQYGDTWTARDESLAVAHLFLGFTSTISGLAIPGASQISMSLNLVSEEGDSTHADSLDVYRVIRVLRLVAAIEIPDTYGGVIYNLDSAQAFYLVRGDVAVLRSGQPASADRWYIRRWDELAVVSPSFAARIGPMTNNLSAATWGKLKALSR